MAVTRAAPIFIGKTEFFLHFEGLIRVRRCDKPRLVSCHAGAPLGDCAGAAVAQVRSTLDPLLEQLAACCIDDADLSSRLLKLFQVPPTCVGCAHLCWMAHLSNHCWPVLRSVGTRAAGKAEQGPRASRPQQADDSPEEKATPHTIRASQVQLVYETGLLRYEMCLIQAKHQASEQLQSVQATHLSGARVISRSWRDGAAGGSLNLFDAVLN